MTVKNLPNSKLAYHRHHAGTSPLCYTVSRIKQVDEVELAVETPSPQRSQGAEALLTPQQPDSPQAACLQTEPPLPASAEVARQRTSVWITSLPDQPAGDSCGGVSLGAECSKQQGDSSGSAEAAEGSGASGLVRPPLGQHTRRSICQKRTQSRCRMRRTTRQRSRSRSLRRRQTRSSTRSSSGAPRGGASRRLGGPAWRMRGAASPAAKSCPRRPPGMCCLRIQRGGFHACMGANCKHLLARCSCRIPWPVSARRRKLPQLQQTHVAVPCNWQSRLCRRSTIVVEPPASGWRPRSSAPPCSSACHGASASARGCRAHRRASQTRSAASAWQARQPSSSRLALP